MSWDGKNAELTGRTLEESFALQNLYWTQDEKRKGLGVRVILKKKMLELEEMHSRLYARIKGSGFKKTDFALGVLMSDPAEWSVPDYIDRGLKWLAAELSTNEALTSDVVTEALEVKEAGAEIKNEDIIASKETKDDK